MNTETFKVDHKVIPCLDLLSGLTKIHRTKERLQKYLDDTKHIERAIKATNFDITTYEEAIYTLIENMEDKEQNIKHIQMILDKTNNKTDLQSIIADIPLD